MHHEVLLALAGHCGDLIVNTGTKFEVASGVTALSQSDKTQIERVLPIGYLALRLNEFVERVTTSSTLSGAYRHSLCIGLGTVLAGYRSSLVEIEGDLTADPALPTGFIRYKLREYELLFPALWTLVQEIDSRKLHGGRILNCLDKHAQTGVPVVRFCMLRLQRHCHQVLYNQLIAWVGHGTLIDTHGEFFIKAPRAAGGDSDAGLPLDGMTMALSSRVRPSGGRDGVLGSGVADPVAAEHYWNTGYSINASMLPFRYFPLRVAEKVLFIGKAVQLLKQPLESTRISSEEMLMPEADTRSFVKALRQLKNAPEFHLLTVECTFDRIKDVIEQHLWELVVRVAELPLHFAALRNYALLGRGELYQMFVEHSLPLMVQPPRAHAETDINDGAFKAAAAASGADKDPLFARLRLGLDVKKFSMRSRGPSSFLAVGAMTVRHREETTQKPDLLRLFAARTACPVQLSMRPRGGHSDGNSAGAVWFSRQMAVVEGWATQFSVCLGAVGERVAGTGTSTGPSGAGAGSGAGGGMARSRAESGALGTSAELAFVIQNCSSKAAGLGGRGGDSDFSGIDDGLAVRLRMAPVDGDADGNWKVDVEVLCGDVSSRRPLSCSRECRLDSAEFTPMWDTAVPLQLSIRYRQPTVGAAEPLGILDISEGHGETARLVLRVRLRLMSVMSLAGAHGRSWCGFAAVCGASCPAVTVTDWETSCESSADEGWEGLGLYYEVPWPLHLVITQGSLVHYSDLFRFLLFIKRVSLALQTSWGQMMVFKGQGYQALLKPLWMLRSRMSFVVDNLYSYLQMDVFDSAYSKLCDAISRSKNFEAVKRAHQEFITTVTVQSYLRDRTRRDSIFKILHLAMDFAALVKRVASEPKSMLPQEATRLDALAKEFRKNGNYLFTLLRPRPGEAPSSLMLRMDFNGYFVSLVSIGRRMDRAGAGGGSSTSGATGPTLAQLLSSAGAKAGAGGGAVTQRLVAAAAAALDAGPGAGRSVLPVGGGATSVRYSASSLDRLLGDAPGTALRSSYATPAQAAQAARAPPEPPSTRPGRLWGSAGASLPDLPSGGGGGRPAGGTGVAPATERRFDPRHAGSLPPTGGVASYGVVELGGRAAAGSAAPGLLTTGGRRGTGGIGLGFTPLAASAGGAGAGSAVRRSATTGGSVASASRYASETRRSYSSSTRASAGQADLAGPRGVRGHTRRDVGDADGRSTASGTTAATKTPPSRRSSSQPSEWDVFSPP